ncbi:MAG: crossover junction endodeoxyribonuclease RuvC [Candidatus Brocadiales bacterium]
MRALGIDPGLAVTGFAVVEALEEGGRVHDYGCIRTSSKLSTPERLGIIYNRVCEVISKWSPNLLVMEDIFVNMKYPKAALQLGEVRGVISVAAQSLNVSVSEVRPSETKLAITGNGGAGKKQVEDAVRRILNIDAPSGPSHVSDALALALTGLSRSGLFNWP